MLFTFIGTISLGLGVAGTWMLLVKLFRLKAPRWAIPVVAGGAMLVFHVYVEYSWFQRTRGSLPPQVAVVEPLTQRNVLQPWTLIVPQVDRFTAVDRGRLRTHPDQPGYVVAEVAFVARYYPTIRTDQLYDCTQPRRADMLPSTTFAADGMPEDVVWIALEQADAVRAVVCAGS